MITIVVKKNESIDNALKRFNQAVLADGLMKELKDRSHYEKPSIKKRRKRLEARKLREATI